MSQAAWWRACPAEEMGLFQWSGRSRELCRGRLARGLGGALLSLLPAMGLRLRHRGACREGAGGGDDRGHRAGWSPSSVLSPRPWAGPVVSEADVHQVGCSSLTELCTLRAPPGVCSAVPLPEERARLVARLYPLSPSGPETLPLAQPAGVGRRASAGPVQARAAGAWRPVVRGERPQPSPTAHVARPPQP